MKIATRLLLAACLVLPFAACKKQEAAAPVQAAALSAPATADDAAWKAYRRMWWPQHGRLTNKPFVDYLTGQEIPSSNPFKGQFDQVSTHGTRHRRGNLIAFVRPSGQDGRLIVAGFQSVPPDTMKRSRSSSSARPRTASGQGRGSSPGQTTFSSSK